MNIFSSIIFSDSYSDIHNDLVNNRTLASIPFGGRFRMVDFVLSSLVNAGVSNVAVISKKNYASLEDHLGGGRYWDLDHRNSGLRILSPFYKNESNNEAYMARGRLDALRSVQTYIKSVKEEYVVLANPNLVANIDFDDVFEKHIESGADITAVYSRIVSTSPHNLEFDVDADSRVHDITYSIEDKKSGNISLNIYVLKRSLLLDIILRADAHDYYSFEKYALIKGVNTYKIMGYEHKGFARIIYTVKDYYDVSMECLDASVRAELFNLDRPVMTRVKDSVPVLYQYNSKVENSLIADGCRIDGTVKNSIIFRNVTIETGAVVENSIIMQNSVIEENSKLDCVILDKNIKISEDKNMRGAADYPYVLVKNTEI